MRRFLALALLLAADAWAAQPVAYFLKGTVPGTLRYQVLIEGAARGPIEGTLGDLTNLEVLAGPILAQEISWRGAQPAAVTVLTWVVRAPTPGPIAVGPTTVRLGDVALATNPVTGAALAGGRARSEVAQPGLRLELSVPTLAVGEPLVVRFVLEGDAGAPGSTWDVQASFPDSWSERLPASEAQAKPPASGAPALARWLVIPVHPGRLEIPPAVARAADAGEDTEGPGLPGRALTSRPARVDVVAPPPAPDPFFGAVGDLEFSRRLLAADPRAGELAALELEVRGVGNLPLLDPPPAPLPPGVRSFPAEDAHEWQPTRRGLAGWRRWRIPLEIAQPGTYTLPEVTFCSYRPGGGYVKHVLPALALAVRPGPPASVPAREPLRPADSGAARLALALAAAFVAGGAAAVLAARRWTARRAGLAVAPAAGSDPAVPLRVLQQAVEVWARDAWGVAVGEGPARLEAAGCPVGDAAEASALVQTIERLRFAPGLSNPAEVIADLALRVARLTTTRSRSADTLIR